MRRYLKPVTFVLCLLPLAWLLARAAGIDEAGLAHTVSEYNAGAVQGQDLAFGRGRTSFNRYLADPEHRPNPCVAPIQTGPF